MDRLVLVARAALALVFAVAAVAKLRGLAEFREAARAFGVPARLVGAISVAIPVIEGGIAVALTSGLAWPGAIAAAGLLALFTAGIAVNLIRGRTPACRCFGQLRAKPIGADTLVRNAAFLVLAGAVVAAGPARSAEGLLGATSALTGARPFVVMCMLVGAAIITGQAVLQWNLMLQNGRLLRRVEHLERHTGALAGSAPVQPHPTAAKQLPVGAAAPAFDLATATGGTLSLDSLRADGKAVLLVFTEPGCPACKAFMPVVRVWEERYASRLAIAVITTAAPDAAHVSRIRTALFQQGHEVADLYGISAIPAGLLVRADGTVGSAVMLGGDAIAALLPTDAARDDFAPAISIREALA